MVNDLRIDLVLWVRKLWRYARDTRNADPVNPLRIVFGGENLKCPAPTCCKLVITGLIVSLLQTALYLVRGPVQGI